MRVFPIQAKGLIVVKKPFILQFAVPQKSGLDGVSYKYSPELNLNVIERNIPYVHAATEPLEMVTKTGVPREGPDLSAENNMLHLIDTMTKVDREGSDLSQAASIDLDTATRVARESSDTNKHSLLELMTKTEAQRERDD